DLQKSIVLNDNRILYRSRLLLDQDLAARSAALARIYENLNFDKVGLVESFKSINKDPTNFSAHRFLSDSFAALPRHEIAQASELLQAQLLQPINITPLQPQLSRTDLALLGGVGQTRPGSNEFNPLFNSNRVALQANGAAGSRNTWGDDVILSGIHDGLSISASQFHFENAGFRQNDWLRQNSYNLFSQMSVTPQLNVQAEVAYEEIQSGDLRTRLTGFHDNDVQENRYRTIGRAGLHYAIGPSQDLIFSAIYEKNNAFSENILSVADTSSKSDNYELELQHLYSGELFKTITGGGYVGGERRDKIDLVLLPPPFNHSSEKIPTEYYNGYAYSFLTPLHTLTATLGLSYDGFSEQEVNNNQWNPKFGLLWNPFEATTIRMAAFRVLKRPYTANQTIEPAQIAGFNQFFDENNGADYWRYGVGLDQKLGLGLFAGLEASWRDIEQPLFSTASGFATQNQNEQMHRAYLYWAPWSMLSVSLEYRYEFRDRSFDLRNSDLTNPTRLSTHIVPFSVNFFHPNGIFATFGGNYVDQQGDFVVSDTSQSSNRVDRFQDSFWVFDTSLGYRFPRRLGLVNLSVANLFNSSFLFQDDINPGRQRLPRFRPERTILVNVRFSF
ncbi:MAG: TonB-dependent receptor, partial [Gammaproteobacteria bacterium]